MRIFICHTLDLSDRACPAVQLFHRLCQRLRAINMDVVVYDAPASAPGFLAFFAQNIILCQYCLVFQTRETSASVSIQAALAIAREHIVRKQLQEILRFVVCVEEEPASPSIWSAIRTFDASQDYDRALEKLLFALVPTWSDIEPDASLIASSKVPILPMPGGSPAPLLPAGADLPVSPWPDSQMLHLPPRYDRPRRLPRRSLTGKVIVPLVLLLILGLSGCFFVVILPRHLPGAGQASLSDLSTAGPAQQTPQAWATATAQALATTPQGLYTVTARRAPAFIDALTGPSKLQWTVVNFSGGGGCTYNQGGDHASIYQKHYFARCMAQAFHYTSFLFQVNMTIVSGSADDSGGLIFGAAGAAEYRLRISLNGSYSLVTPTKELASGTSRDFKTGLSQSNLLAIAIVNHTMTAYINGKVLFTLKNMTPTTGRLGLLGLDWSAPVNIAYKDARIWTLS